MEALSNNTQPSTAQQAVGTSVAMPAGGQLQGTTSAAPPGLSKQTMPADATQPGLEGTKVGEAPSRDTSLLVPPPIPKPAWPAVGAGGQPRPAAALPAPPSAGGRGAIESSRKTAGYGLQENGVAVPGRISASVGVHGQGSVQSGEVAGSAAGASVASSDGISTGVGVEGAAEGARTGPAAAAATAAAVGAVAATAEGTEEADSRKRGRVLTGAEAEKRAREMQLKDFLLAVKEYGSTVPGEATRFHLQRGGLSTSNNQM